MPVTLDTETIRLITLFENVTGTGVKDCLVDSQNNTAYFVIEEGWLGKAIGKNGSIVKRTEGLIKKGVKIFEFSGDLERFVRNLIPQATATKFRNEDGKIVVDVWVGKSDKAIVIGRDGKNLKVFKELLQRSHNVNEVVVR
ncbi:MAG: NusA-like transcription termination signal-binding factor [Candidatus Aenigmarchaeota archaeon]|nr:NusA-like transcription termination signal-binding factor [Candidatus Aenigmarchaeota archaeon]